MRPAEDSEKDGGRTSTTDRRIAYALLRIVFAVNIFLHGISRLVGDHAAFLAYLSQQMAKAPISKSLLPPFATALPWTEATIGLLLLLGLFTRFAPVAAHS
jgi:thiosulfate dehydrogenase [quinone] large subunit